MFRLSLLVLITALCAACASSESRYGSTTSPRGGRASLATISNAQYLRIEPSQTGVVNAADDGRFTFIAFDRNVPADAVAFDQDGQPLRSAAAGPVMAVLGVHKGVLVRTVQGSSFVAPNPNASESDRVYIDGDQYVVEARNKLTSDVSVRPAYERALERTAAVKDGSVSINAPVEPPLTVETKVATNAGQSGSSDLKYERGPNSVLIRAFFAAGSASGGWTDADIQALASEARTAKEVRIAGFVDFNGKAANGYILAQQRAEAVRDALVALGVDAKRIYISPIGYRRTINEDADRGVSANRRVEILMSLGKPPVKPKSASALTGDARPQ